MRIAFEADGTKYPTDDGRTLTFGPGDVLGTLTLRLVHRDESDCPVDVIAADYAICDAEGNTWQTTSSFTTELLVSQLVNYAECESDLFRIDDSMLPFQASPLIKNVRYSSDDRFFRRLQIGAEQFEVQFKYTTISFDLHASEDTDDVPYLTKLAVRVNAKSLFADSDDVGEFGYFIALHHLLRSNTAVFSEDYNTFKDSPLPQPLVFQQIETTGSPQTSVTIT